MEPRLPGLDGASLADAAWALARLGADVPAPWLAALVAAVDAALEEGAQDSVGGGDGGGGVASEPGTGAGGGAAALEGPFGLGGGALAERASAQARGYAAAAAAGGPDSQAAAAAAADAAWQQGERLGDGGGGTGVDARRLAVLIWSLSQLGHRPPRSWLLAFKALSERQLGEGAARQLARFIAGALLQQQRRRDAPGAGGSRGRPDAAAGPRVSPGAPRQQRV